MPSKQFCGANPKDYGVAPDGIVPKGEVALRRPVGMIPDRPDDPDRGMAVSSIRTPSGEIPEVASVADGTLIILFFYRHSPSHVR
jgi:hypothetical protein